MCGLERRLLLERADLNEIAKEVIRIRAVYASSRLLELHLNRFLSFSLVRFGFKNVDSHVLMTAFEKPPPNCKEDDLAVALAWFALADLHLPAPWAMAIAGQHPRVSNRAGLAGQNDQLTSLFKLRYRERFGTGLKLKSTEHDRELRYRPVNPSLEYRDESEEPLTQSIRIPDTLRDHAQFTSLADLLVQSIADLPPPTSAARPGSQALFRADDLKKPAPCAGRSN